MTTIETVMSIKITPMSTKMKEMKFMVKLSKVKAVVKIRK